MKLYESGEDYLEAVLMLQKKNGMVRSVDLARHMEVSKPSVCHAVATLRDGGFLIRFVLDCMRENTTKIRNIKQYLRAVLFNAPSTIGNYYTSLVAHDMASGALTPRKPKFGDPDYYSCNEGESL